MTCNIPSIGVALAASGFLNAAPDADGILRRAPLLIRYDGRNYPNLALAAYLAQAPAEPLIVEAQGGALALQFRHRRIVMDERGTMLLRFHGASGAFARFPASDVVAGSIGRRWLEGKIVLVGSSAPGLRQSAITPLDHFFPGIELHATVLDNLLHGDFLFHSAGGWFWEKVVALLLGLTATAMLFSGPGAWRIAVAAAQLVLLWSAVWNSLFRDNAYFSPVPGTITLACVFLAYGIHRGAIAQARAVETLRKLAVARKFTLNALAAVMEARDAETGAHLLRTQGYTRVLCRALKRNPRFETFLTSETIELLVQLAPIHDIGKIGVPDHILRKPGPLTHEEYAFMRRHVEFGREVILRASQRSGMDDQELLNLALDIIGSHHEHWNGHGYPRGLRGDQIPIAGRVLAVVDMYDALVSRRIYKESYPHAEAKRLIQTASGSQFDPDVVEAFLRTEDHWLQIAQEFGDGGAGG